jgi:ABC-type transport system substrate-binding protein
MLYQGLYRYDEHFAPVPDLAAKPCDVSSDLVTITCQLAESTFSDGSPATADDVVFTYQLAMNEQCHWPFTYPCGRAGTLAGVTALDARTVRFTLHEPDALFFTLDLPDTYIDSKSVVTAEYKTFIETARPIGGQPFHDLSDRIGQLLDRDPKDPECAGPLQEAERLSAKAGLEVAADALQFGAGTCGDLSTVRDGYIDPIGDALDAGNEIDSIAAIYGSLPFQRAPVGSGPWRLSEYQAKKQLALEAKPGAVVATRRFVFRQYQDRRAALTDETRGDVDWVAIPGTEGFAQGSTDLVRFASQDSALQLVHYPVAGAYTVINYNVRPGKVMADPAIREAVERCIDKPAIVEAATDGLSAPAWSFVSPSTWAEATNLGGLPRDTGYARARIESAAWKVGDDGYYHKDGRRLGITVLVGENRIQRLRFLELAKLQLRDCGFDLGLETHEPGAISRALSSWPLTFPDDKTSFDAVLWTAFGAVDPGNECSYESGEIVSPGKDNGCNSSGYKNATVDQELAAARATYDLATRTRYYKDVQAILANDHAALFAWFNTQYDVLGPGIRTTEGAIDRTNAGWSWRPEAIVKAASPPTP